MSWERFDINLMNNGGVISDLHAAMDEAFKDIHLINKPAAKTRRVELIVEFIPDDERSNIAVKATVKTKFPADSPRVDMVHIEPKTKAGYINQSEQLPLGYDPATGEVETLIRKDGSDD